MAQGEKKEGRVLHKEEKEKSLVPSSIFKGGLRRKRGKVANFKG